MGQPPLNPPPRDPFPGLPLILEERLRLTEAQRAEQNVSLRGWYAKGILIGLGVEAAASLVALFGIGLQWLHIGAAIADAFFVTVFGQIVGLAHIVVRHLFPRQDRFDH